MMRVGEEAATFAIERAHLERGHHPRELAGALVIRCLLCGAASANLNDVRYRYCVRCHLFHDVVAEARRAHRQGATHDCGEWLTAAGACAVCERAVTPARPWIG
jgi:hypothetical protein